MSRSGFRAVIPFVLAMISPLALASAAQASLPPDSLYGRPIIIFIHGRGAGYRIMEELRQEFFGAFRGGLDKLSPSFNGVITDKDLEFVFYGYVFEAGGIGTYPCPRVPLVPAQANASTSSPYVWAQGVPERRQVIDKLKSQFGGSSLVRGWIIDGLDDVARYLSDSAVACEVDQALVRVLRKAREQHRPIVLVGYSMGALVAYRTLTLAQDSLKQRGDSGVAYDIVRLVTIGTQLGLPGLPGLLLGHGATDRFPAWTWSWVDIKGREDVASFGAVANPAMTDVFPPPVQLEIPTNPEDRHWVGGYLKHPLTALAIVRGWCNAFPTNTAPDACTNLHADACQLHWSIHEASIRRFHGARVGVPDIGTCDSVVAATDVASSLAPLSVNDRHLFELSSLSGLTDEWAVHPGAKIGTSLGSGLFPNYVLRYDFSYNSAPRNETELMRETIGGAWVGIGAADFGDFKKTERESVPAMSFSVSLWQAPSWLEDTGAFLGLTWYRSLSSARAGWHTRVALRVGSAKK